MVLTYINLYFNLKKNTSIYLYYSAQKTDLFFIVVFKLHMNISQFSGGDNWCLKFVNSRLLPFKIYIFKKLIGQ